MILAFDGSSIDGPAYTEVVNLARQSPALLDDVVSAWSTYVLGLFAVLMFLGWWRARQMGSMASLTALAVPFVVVLAYGAQLGTEVAGVRGPALPEPARDPLKACPAPGDWSFPSNHAPIAAAAAVTLLFVSRRLGAVAVVAACVMAASRVRVGALSPRRGSGSRGGRPRR